MDALINMLHLEDDPADAKIVRVTLAETILGCNVTLVQTRAEFEAALDNGSVDIILADYKLPTYDGMAALRLVNERYPEIPFIFVSGTMGVESAIEALTQGAADYVPKHQLSSLDSVVRRALQQSRNRRDRLQAQEALKSSNEMLRAIIYSAPVAIISLDLEGRVHSVWNPAAERMFGWRAQDVMGRPLPTVPDDCKGEFKQLQEQIRNGMTLEGVELRQQRHDGTLIDCSIYSSLLYEHQGQISGSINVLVDISQQKQAESSIRKLTQAVEQSPVSIVITDVEGRIEFVNAKFTQITGYTFAEALGQNPRFMKSGKTPVEEYSRLWKTICSGGVWQGEFHNRKKNGELFWEKGTIAPVRDVDEVITHYVAVKEDITACKKLEAQLRQSQNMETIGQLVGGAAHDFKNMLAVIMGHAERALEKVAPDDSLTRDLEKILGAGRRSTEITRQLLAFSRQQTIAPKNLDLNESVEKACCLCPKCFGVQRWV